MVRSLARRGMPKPLAILIAVLMALYVVPLGALPAEAADVGGFEIEGNTTDEPGGGIDWASLNVGSAGFSTGVDNTVGGQDDTTFQGSSKEFDESGSGAWPSWQFGTGNATGKSDFGRWATYDVVDADDHVWFYFAFDRGFGTGTAKYAFELNQVTQSPTTDANPDRSQGDIRLVIYDQGNGVVTLTADKQNPDVGVYVWDDPDHPGTGAAALDSNQNGEWVKSTDQDGVFSGASNTGETPISVPGWWTGGNTTNGTLAKDTFLEFGIDLTSYGAVLGCPSTGFTAVNARSITGTGGPGTLVDYLSAIPVTIPSSCASLVINKTDADQQALGGATFKIEPNPLPVGTPGRPDANFITIFDDSDANTAKEGSTTYDDPDATAGKITLSAVVPDVQYTITEIAPPAGYVGESGSKTAMPEAFGGDSVTFVNTLGSVTFFKQYAGPNDEVPSGASFRLVRDSDGDGDFAEESGTDVIAVTDNGTNDADNTLGEIEVVDLKTGDYKLTETNAPTGWVKDGDAVFFSIPGANNTADVVLESPTFQNPRQTYPLTVRKVAEDDNSVTIDGAVFELYQESGDQAGLQLNGDDADTLVGTCTTGAGVDDADGECTVTGLAWGEAYYWYEVSVPAPYNLPDDRVVGPITIAADGTTDPAGVAQFEDPQSAIETNATNGILPAGSIGDSATLTGVREDAGGSITFRLYSDTTCSTLVWTSAAFPVDGPGTYGPATTSVGAAGDYYWIASYSGDASTGTLPVAGECMDEGETSTVAPAEPGIVTIVDDADVSLSDEDTFIKDHATLSGATTNATGSIEFKVYGPFDSDPSGDATVCVVDNLFATVAATSTVSGNGSYTSADVQVSDSGYYIWVASYSGDANNEPAAEACGSADEVVQVTKAEPSVTTDAQQDTVTLGALPTSLTDKATLTGATSDATGSIAFVLYGPFDSAPGADDCTVGAAVAEVGSVESFAGNGTYTSMPVVVTEAGYYTWVATYSGDDNNEGASHACGLVEETTLVNPAQPDITTTAGPDQVIGTDGADLTDTATLSGATADATGTITYSLYGPFASDPTGNAEACVQGVLVDSVTNPDVDGNGDYVSPAITVDETGYYVWVASYSGDDNNEDATHACGVASEVVQVTPRQPVITTDVPGPNTLTLGAEGTVLSDTATLSEATTDATGSISFQLYGPYETAPGADDCLPGDALGAPVAATSAVSGNGVYTSATKTVYAAGFYTWVATYSGDVNNNSATHACGLADETVEVTKARTSITTEVSDATMQLAPTASLVDTATLSGATVNPAAGGTISFTLYGPFDTDPTGETDVCVEGSIAGTAGTTTAVSGPGTYTSEPVTVSEAGWYVWVASYSGDANNLASTHGCGDAKEITEVDKAAPTITTQVPSATVRLAPTATLTDTATLSGATVDPAATGTITFSLYGPFEQDPGAQSCTPELLVGTRTAVVDGNGSYTPATGIEVGVAGFYTWVASYDGDANNESATHACGLANETVEVLKAQGEITTDAVDRVKLSDGPTTISDEATLTGVTVDPAATGTIEFKVYGPFDSQPDAESCTGDLLVGGGPYTVEVDGPGTYVSPDVRVKEAGYYVWVASYSGDANNEAATHACGLVEETSVVDKATPTITTQVPAATVALPDASLSDSATLSGATTDPAATGTITFRLYGPFAEAPAAQSCVDGSLVATRVVDVDGNGTYASPAVVVTKAGFYTWVATYSGDANNESATHACGLANETVEVTKAVTDITTVATSDAIIKLGQTISDSASVTGLTDDATGTVTFNLYGPDNATCTGAPVFTSTVPLVVTVTEAGATGAATSAAYAPTAAGTYRWVASYSGDGNNAVSAGECNDPNEQSVVRAGDNPNLDKFSNPASGSTVQPGTRIDYSVKVWNTGDVAITNADVLDILPPNVTVVPGSISDGGVLSADGSRITWKVTLAPADANSTADEKTLTYAATVNADAPEGAVLVNTARFLGLEDTTTHVVPTGDLTIVKEVSPVAGGGVVVSFGDTLTYTLTVTATGTLDQPNTVVRDYVPGFDPERPQSGTTTYVAGSATCVGAGTCTVTEPGVDGLISWSLGTVPAGTTRQVTFQVVIDQVTGEPGETVAVDILNAGSVESARTPRTPSNEVVTPVTEVFPIKESNPPKEEPRVLPRTGSGVPIGDLLTTGAALLLTGLVLLVGSRRRGAHRR